MRNDRYGKKVQEEFRACLESGMTLPEEEIWELAKKMVKLRRHCRAAALKAKREGRDYVEVLEEEEERQRINSLN